MTDLGELFGGFRRSAWRLEARDIYDIGDEREQFEEFLETGHASVSDEDREYQSFVRNVRNSGREIGRVRVVGRPVTQYTEFEFDYYPALVAAGEEIRVLDRAALAGKPGPWDTDFWIFDDAVVAIMEYSAGGEYLGVRVLTDESDAQRYLQARTRARELSCDLADYTLPHSRSRRPVA